MRALIVSVAAGAMMFHPVVVGATQTRDEQRVLDLDQAWADAEVAHDATALRRILDPRFVATFGSAAPVDREGFIRAVLAVPRDPTLTQQLGERVARIDHDTALVTETATVSSGAPTLRQVTVYRLTVVYVRRGDGWRAIAVHSAIVPTTR